MPSSLAAACRLMLLELLARWRGRGVGLLVALALWALVCFGQEPLLLRSFGAAVGPQGLVVGAGVALLGKITLRRNLDRGPWWQGPLCAAAHGMFLALVVGALALLAACLPNQADGARMAGRAIVAFLALFLPLAILLGPAPRAAAARFRIAVAVAYAPLGAALASACFAASVPARLWPAAALLCLGAVAAVLASANPSAHAHRDPR